MFSPEIERRLKRPEAVRQLLTALENDEAASYELLFHAAFSDKLFGVMRTTGPQGEGFDRMQQTFGEAVEKVRSAIRAAEGRGFLLANDYTQLTAQSMSNLFELMHDLSVVKHSSNDE